MEKDYFFQFYPTLLNQYHRFLKLKTEEEKRNLINKINRVPEYDVETLQKFRKGIAFENAVLKNKPGEFDPKLIVEAARLLPKRRKTQQLLSFNQQNIKFYGFADVLGEGRVIDLKSTANYVPNKHAFNFQNLYLYALKDAGFKRMEYIICDFENIYVETYQLGNYDFEAMLSEMETFKDFLIDNATKIIDKKIMTKMSDDFFSL